ncbi:MAG: ABC transporter permease [Myxococcales bacterium]|nr:ABC transporter permease [Myxococcales bacterium]
MVPFHYNVRSLWVRKLTTAVTIAGVALVTLVLAAALMLAEGVTKTVTAGGRPDVAMVVRAGATGELESNVDEEAVGLVLSQPGVKQVEGAPQGTGEVVIVLALDKIGQAGLSNVVLRGVTDRSRATRPDLQIVDGRLPSPGSDEAMVGRAIAGRFRGLEIGSSVELRPNRPLRIVGIFEAGGSGAESEVWADLDVIRSSIGRSGGVSVVRVELSSAEAFDAFQAAIESDRRLGLDAKRETDFLEAQSEGLSLFIRIMGMVIAVFFSIGAIIGATITMHAAVAHRTREIGTLRAIGFSRGAILAGFLAEAVVMTVIGGAVGIALSFALTTVKVSMVNNATWSELVFTFAATPSAIVTAFVFSSGMGVLGGYLPAVRASRIPPLAALRS